MMRSIKCNGRLLTYELIKTARKSLEIRVVSRGNVRVFAPERSRLREVDSFVSSRAEWIDEAIRSLEDYAKRREAERPMEDGATILYEGQTVELRIGAAARAYVAMEDGALRVGTVDLSPDAVRALIRDYLYDCAKARIEDRLAHFIPLVGRAPSKVTIRDQRTRWGSCSNRNNLNFNYKLIMAPPEALDYVVLHELCHLYDFNHSDRFWKRVASHQPDYAVWKRWLADNGNLLGV